MKVRLCAAAELPLGEVRRCELADGRALALYRLEDGVFATDDLCTHGAANLSDGEIEDGNIVCPYHLGAFDIRTGEATAAPCQKALRSYRVVEADGALFVEGETVGG
jgi:nitrite reductase/ring-hydroxylating ferredoxin subunit